MTTRIPRRFILAEAAITPEGWAHLKMPWGAQIINVDLINRIHIGLWALTTDDQPLQDRYFINVQDDTPIPSNVTEAKHIGSLNASGAGVHIFEVIRS